MTNKFHVRVITSQDAKRISDLTMQLGYEADKKAILDRLKLIERAADHTILCAESPNGMVGIIHYFIRPSIEKGICLVVQSLVTDAAYRGQGIGRLLMLKAEEEARSRGVGAITLSSRIDRDDAHAFYRQLGYEPAATSHWLVKSLQ